MTQLVLGIDISKAKFDVALLQAEQYRTATFSNDAQGIGKLARWLQKRRVERLHACLEATGTYGEELALFLQEASLPVMLLRRVRTQQK